MAQFHVVEYSLTEPVEPGVERSSFSYEVVAEDGRPVPHRFATQDEAFAIANLLSRFVGRVGDLAYFKDLRLVHGWRTHDETLRLVRRSGGATPAAMEVWTLGGERVIVLRGFASDEEVDRFASVLRRTLP